MISFDNFIFLQSVSLELQHGWFLCYNHFFFIVAFYFDLWTLHNDILIIVAKYIFIGLHDGWFLCDNHDFVCIQFILEALFQKPLYAHNSNVIINICWKYVSSWIWYGHGKIWIWMYSPPNWWYWQFYEMRKRNVFPTIIILAFYGILWSKVRKWRTFTYPLEWMSCMCSGWKFLIIFFFKWLNKRSHG